MFLDSLDSSVFLCLFCRFRQNYLKQQQQKQQQNSVTNNERFFPSYISAEEMLKLSFVYFCFLERLHLQSTTFNYNRVTLPYK